MKKLIYSLSALLVLSVPAPRVAAQSEAVSGFSVEMQKDTVARLTLFNAKTAEGKVYLHWRVSEQHMDGMYFVYRSQDGQNYSLVGKKRGTGVDACFDIAYYFTDETPFSLTTYYKVLHISKENTFLTSDVITILPDTRTAFSTTQ